MTKLNQKEAVHQAICSVKGTTEFDGPVQMTKEERAQVNMILVEGFKAGRIELEKEFDESALKAYVSGLQSNWLRKDKRLNGGTQYIAKNPGSRQGASDPMLKNLRALKSTLSDPADIAEVEAHIAKRLSEIKPTKTVQIDYSNLPAELQAKFQK